MSSHGAKPDDAPPPYEEAIATSNNPFLRPPPSSPGPSSGRPRANSAREYSRPALAPPSPGNPGYLSPHLSGSGSHSPSPSRPSSQGYPGSGSGSHAASAHKPLPPKPLPVAPGPIPRQFPQTFNLYTKFMSRTMLLGEHQDQPFYAVEMTSGFRDPTIILHSGPTDAHPRLATLDFMHFHYQMSVHLPPAAHNGAPTELIMDTGYNFPHTSYCFTIEVGNSGPRGAGGRWPLENFEWRRSRGDAVANLGGSSYGWKLVRLAGGPPPGASEQGRLQYISGGHRGSDGSEVVAVFSAPMFGGNKAMLFSFVGTGASGLLGERWSIMAVMTALGLFEKMRREDRQRRR